MTPGDTTALKDESRSVSKREFRCQQGRIYGCSSLALFPPVSEFFWNACQFLHIEDALCTYLPKKTLGEIHINIAVSVFPLLFSSTNSIEMIPTSDACVPSQKTRAERTCPWKMLTSRGSSKRGELRKGQEKHRVVMAVG